jgi:hypothetical protein
VKLDGSAVSLLGVIIISSTGTFQINVRQYFLVNKEDRLVDVVVKSEIHCRIYRSHCKQQVQIQTAL